MPISREVLGKLYKSMSDEEIAKQYGYSPRYITKLRRIYGLYKRRKWSKCPEISKQDLEKLYKSMSDNEIAKIYGVSANCIKMLRLRYRLLRRRLCPEISREVLEKMIDKTDLEIAMIYNTKPHCITQKRLKLGVRKYMVGHRDINVFRGKADKVEDFLLRKIEVEGICYTTTKEIKEELRISTHTDIWDELARRGYKTFKIWGKYIGLDFPRTFIYKPGCEELVATEILMEIMRQVERTKKRRDIKEVKKAASSIIRRHLLPKEMEEALKSVLKDMAKLLKSSLSSNHISTSSP
jgi:DNA-binding CsgD family transcriptional regulator